MKPLLHRNPKNVFAVLIVIGVLALLVIFGVGADPAIRSALR
jgi:hypothetical protein